MIFFDINCVIVFLGIIRFNEFMYQTIHETIKVGGIFHQAQFKPLWFVWQEKRFDINEITLISDLKNGKVKKKLFSVLANDNLYRLDYCPADQTWFLEQIWVD